MIYKNWRSKGISALQKAISVHFKFVGLKFAAVLAVLSAALLSAEAHPYASGLTNTSGTISFILNEAADDVKIIFDGGAATNDLGSLASGVQSFSLASHNSYSIVVSKAGSGVISLISMDATNNDFFGPRGVAVNRNPQSHDFGRIYVANASAGAGPSRTTTRGLYVLNADTSDALGYGAIAHGTNGITLGSSTTYAPYRVFVASDNQVYFGDASGSPTGGGNLGGGAVWMLNPDLNTPTAVFKFGLGGTTNFGPCASTPIVFGDTNNGNMVLYCSLWNYTNLFTGYTNYTSIYKYNIGAGPLPWNTIPTNYAVVGESDGQILNGVGQDMTIAPDGKIYVTQFRDSGSGGNVTLWVYDTNAETLLFNSSAASGGLDVLSNCYSVAISPDENYFAAIREDGTFFVSLLTNGIPDFATLSTNATTLGSTARGVAFDAADNMYFTSGGADRLRAYSLGLSTTAITGNDATATNGTFQFIANTNLPYILVQPVSQSALAGLSASFAVNASGTAPLMYQWQFNGSNLTDNTQFTGSLTNTLSLASTQTNNAGSYTVIVSNLYGSVTSQVASLTVTIPSNEVPIVWTQFANSPGVNTVRHDDIYFTDPTNGWASQNSFIYRTTNGGATWTTNLNLGGTHFRSIGFATPLIGFAGNLGVGSYDSGVTNTNILYRTIDGGVTWSNVDGFSEAGMQGLCSIHVLDSQHIYGGGRVRGTNAFVIISTNGGFNWKIVNLSAQGVMNAIMDIHFMDPTNGWVVGMDTNSYYSPPYYGRIARTADGGNTWTTVVTTPVASSYFWKMAWPSTNIGYVSLQQNASFNNIIFYKTYDGGNTWASNGISLAGLGLGSSAFYLQGIGFVSTNEGWIGGASGIAYSNTFLHTVDGGVTWSPAGFNDTYYINRIRFLTPTLGFACGANLYTFSVPLAITSQPQGQVVQAGTNVNLFVAAAGLSPISYQWLKNGTATPGATTPNLVLSNVTRIDAGTYSVIVTNSAAGLQSSNAIVRVLVPERLASPVLIPGGQLQITFSDADGGNLITSNDLPTFTVQVSTNLSQWSVLTNALSITNGMVLLQDTWTNSPMRYYRISEH